MCLLEILADTLFQYRRRKRPERLTFLDPIVENLFHLSTARVNDDRSISKRAWAKLHPPLEPAHYCAAGQHFSDAGKHLVVR
mgnify:FL=1